MDSCAPVRLRDDARLDVRDLETREIGRCHFGRVHHSGRTCRCVIAVTCQKYIVQVKEAPVWTSCGWCVQTPISNPHPLFSLKSKKIGISLRLQTEPAQHVRKTHRRSDPEILTKRLRMQTPSSAHETPKVATRTARHRQSRNVGCTRAKSL